MVCKNAGKSDFMHETKDRNGQTECPTLLQRRRTFFCKVCKDSGKSEDIFTSHCVKDAKGVVQCPTLLGQACLRCNRKGHTASYCTFQQKQSSNRYDDGNEIEEQELTKGQIQAQRAKAQHVVQAVSFVPTASDFPGLPESLSENVTLRPHQKSWASVAQTPAPIPKPAAVLKEALGIPAATAAATPAAAAPVFVPSAQIAMTLTAENLAIMRQSLKKTTCCWADFDEDD